MKKVAYITPLYFGDDSYVGGGERYPLNMAIGVVEASDGEFEVELLSFGRSSFRRQLHAGVTLRAMKAAYTPHCSLDNLSWELPDAIAEFDLIHIHQAYTRCSEVSYVVAKLHNKPICVSDHGGLSSPLGVQLGSLELADHVVCYSDFGGRLLRTNRPVTCIKGGVDGRRFSPPCPKPTRDRVLFVGRLMPHKGVDRLIRALPPELPLTCCGRVYNDHYLGVLRELARGKQVEFLTEADDATIREMYGRAWATVLPSVYQDYYGTQHMQPELMGFTLLEAMACGTPAICSRVGGMPEFIRHGETGFVFDELDELTGYLRALAADPALVERMGFRARRVVEAEFDLRVCGAKLLDVYHGLLGATNAVRRSAA